MPLSFHLPFPSNVFPIYLDVSSLPQLNTVKDELIATELIFENSLTEMEPEEIIALISALVFELKTDVEVKLTGTLEKVMIYHIKECH